MGFWEATGTQAVMCRARRRSTTFIIVGTICWPAGGEFRARSQNLPRALAERLRVQRAAFKQPLKMVPGGK